MSRILLSLDLTSPRIPLQQSEGSIVKDVDSTLLFWCVADGSILIYLSMFTPASDQLTAGARASRFFPRFCGGARRKILWFQYLK